jgi:phytoene dehydrogenase-like protein
MSDKSIIIIGGGVAGLSAGSYARMNDFKATIFEQHFVPGGLCTAWQRKGYTIDGCVHWLVGSGAGSSLYPIWRDLGVVQGVTFLDHDEYLQVEGDDGRVLHFYCDLNRLEEHLLELSPQDAPVLKDFMKATRSLSTFDPPMNDAPELATAWDKLKVVLQMAKRLPVLAKWSSLSMGEFKSRFKDPLVGLAFEQAFAPEFPVLFIMMTLVWLHRKEAGYPVGGSLPIARGMEKRFVDLGGVIHYRSKVKRILVDRGTAVGVELEDGTQHRADYIVSAADAHATIYDMLDGAFVDEEVRKLFSEYKPFDPLVYVGVGVRRTFQDEAHVVSGTLVRLGQPLTIGPQTLERIMIHPYNFDPTMAPPGCTTIVSMIPSQWDYWHELQQNREAYQQEKARIGQAVVHELDRRYPGLAEQVEMVDVATPVTFHRYTGNWRGSFEGWLATPKTFRTRIRKTLPGLDGFYMIGHWVEAGGGLPPAAASGRHVVQILCHKEKKRFVTH